MWILFPKIQKTVLAEKIREEKLPELTPLVILTTREQKLSQLIKSPRLLSAKRLKCIHKVIKHLKRLVCFWRKTIYFQNTERKSTEPVRPLSFLIHFITDTLDLTKRCMKESTSQSWKRNFGIKCKK